jgi:hypothetical protein
LPCLLANFKLSRARFFILSGPTRSVGSKVLWV